MPLQTANPPQSLDSGTEPCLSVLMPCYNEAGTVEEMLRRVLAQAVVVEVLVVDDGSTDGTWERLQPWPARDGRVWLARHPQNRGKGAAVRTGLALATAPVLVQDADLEYDPADYSRLVEPIRSGRARVVYGTRFGPGSRAQTPWWHRVGKRGGRWAVRLWSLEGSRCQRLAVGDRRRRKFVGHPYRQERERVDWCRICGDERDGLDHLNIVSTDMSSTARAGHCVRLRLAAGGGGAALVLTLRLAALAALGCSGRAHEFQVEGVAVRELYDGGGRVVLIETNFFLVAVRNGQWLISSSAWDGSYRLEQARDLDCLRMGWTRQITGAPDHRDGHRKGNVGFVRLTELPHVPGDPWSPIFWLAYCSGPHLQAATNGMLEPVWLMDNERLHEQGFRLRAHWKLLPGVLGLPEAVDYVSDGIYRGYDRVKQQPREFRLPPPFDQGYTTAVYRAEAVTKCGHLHLPSQFVFRIHLTPLSRGDDPHTCRAVVRGRVLQVSPHCSISAFYPRYSGWACIHDYRWGKKLPPEVLPRGFISYNVTNGVWPEGQELDRLVYQRLRHMAAQQQALRRGDETRRSFSPKLVTAILVLTFCLPVAVLAVRMLQKRGQGIHSREKSNNL